MRVFGDSRGENTVEAGGQIKIDGALVEYPLHSHQHARRMGSSVKTALHSIVYKIDRALEDGLVALGDFMDIEDTFNNTNTFVCMWKAAKEHEVKRGVVRWIRAVLGSRQIVTVKMEYRLSVSVDRGCPRGAVLFPLLWRMIVDGPLARLNREGLCIQGYADDLILLITGKLPSAASENMQRALNIVRSCCKAEELSIDPDRTERMLFIKRKEVDGSVEPGLLNSDKSHWFGEVSAIHPGF